jgi:hypothetical protein
MKPTLYLAAPFSARNGRTVLDNVRVAQFWGAAIFRTGLVYVLVPHNASAGMEVALTEVEWIEFTKDLMRRCDGVIFVPGWSESDGCIGEFNECGLIGLPWVTATTLAEVEDTVRALVAKIEDAKRGQA